MTITTRNKDGLIDTIRLLHRPFGMVQLFSKGLLGGSMGKCVRKSFRKTTLANEADY
jgi:hypothetical protein